MFAASNILMAVRTRSYALCKRSRLFATKSKGEERITELLKAKFPQAAYIQVDDISGGCGAMYEIHIEADEFKNKRTVQQHRMVNDALQEEIKEMHGLRIFTTAPKQ